VGSREPKEAQFQSHSLGGTNVPTWEGTLAPSGANVICANKIEPSVCGGDDFFRAELHAISLALYLIRHSKEKNFIIFFGLYVKSGSYKWI